ncbi:MAG TPA: response regulator [Candidatus Limnocylindria bacterium]|nr:response regulator [Candidatus Limnocylindria bacterium]
MIPERTKVVVVNDNPEFLQLMADVLRDERFPTTIIDGDRDDAVEAIRASRPQLLIIDLRLGRDELHGWEVIQQVRTDRELRELPTLICTGDKEALALLDGDLADMRRVDTLIKPFSIDELTAKLEGLLAHEPA